MLGRTTSQAGPQGADPRSPARRLALRRLPADRRVLLAAVGLLVLVGSVGALATYAGFVVTLTNPGSSPYNSFSSGMVTISDNEASTAMFDVTNAAAGTTGSACIGVEYAGTVPSGSDVYLYAATAGGSGSLGPYVSVAVRDGTDSAPFGAGDRSCAHFTANSDGTLSSHAAAGNAIAATGVDAWPTADATGFALSDTGSGQGAQGWTASPTTVWYRFTYHIASDAPAGASVGVAFTWEANSL